MKWIYFLSFLIYLTSCHKEHKYEYELTSLYWRMKEVKLDSVSYSVEIDTVHAEFYAKFDYKGNCMVIQNDSMNHFKSFTIEKDKLIKILSVINGIKNDTSLGLNSGDYIYDGPTIYLIKGRNGEKPLKVSFADSWRSNMDLWVFYKYITDRISSRLPLNEKLDTTSLIKSRDRLIERLIKEEKLKFPPYKIFKSKIKFSRPNMIDN